MARRLKRPRESFLVGDFPAPYNEPRGDWMRELVELDLEALGRREVAGEDCSEEREMLLTIRRQLS